MKKLHVIGIISLFLISLMAWGIGPVMAQDLEQESEVSEPLGFYESLDKYGVNKAVEIPREEWPPIPAPTRPDLLGKQHEIEREGPEYYQAGIRTNFITETWYGLRCVINGGEIENDNWSTNFVRLTPHVCPKTSSDYIAVVLDATDDEDELILWTFEEEDGSPYYEYEGTIDKDSDYEYSMFIDSNNDYEIYYRSYPSGTWTLIREGSLDAKASQVSAFLEHAINSGDPGEHGVSYWESFVLYESDGSGEWWDHGPSNFDDEPVLHDTWLESGWNRIMQTWSEY